MMNIQSSFAAMLVAVICGANAAEPFDIAVTIDDLPAHGALAPGMTRLGIVQSHIAILKAHRVPEVYGFVNGAKLAETPDGAAVLDAWRQAGFPLGNHGYTHMNLGRAESFEAWRADVLAGEAAIKGRMAGQDWRYFRIPNLSLGGHAGQALSFLQDSGYRVADVSLSFADSSYAEPFARCMTKGDHAGIAAMKASYLNSVDRAIARMKAQSVQVYGRMIPQVLLAHAGAWGAATLSDVLDRLEASGARYVSLAQAQGDPAYATPGGGMLIARAAKAKGINLAEPAELAARPAPARLNLGTLCQ